ncbi:MAG: phosphotransferase family protein [Acidimicrobiia bacterium]
MDTAIDPVAELTAQVAQCLGRDVQLVLAPQGGAAHLAYEVRAKDGEGQSLAFLRTEPAGWSMGPRYGLSREAKMLRGAHRLGFPVPQLLGTPGTPPGLLTEMIIGTSRPDPDEVEAVAPEYLAQIARLHAIDPREFDVDQYDTVRNAIADDLRWWNDFGARTGAMDTRLLRFAARVLSATLPDVGDMPSVVHGDVGAGNFMVNEGRLAAMLDWETAHVGDPHEDLAWLWMRGAHTAFGDPQRRIAEYEAASGTVLDRHRLCWHLAFVMWKSVVGMRAATNSGPADDVTLVQSIVVLTYEALLGAQLVELLGASYPLLGCTPQRSSTVASRLCDRLLDRGDHDHESQIVLTYLRDSASQLAWEQRELAADCRRRLAITPDELDDHVDSVGQIDLTACAMVLAGEADRAALALPNAVRRIQRAQRIGLGVTRIDAQPAADGEM